MMDCVPRMKRTDQAYWQRLRKDRRSNIAAGLNAVSALVATMAFIGLRIPGSQADARADPLYWVILLPFGWWGSSLGAFEAWTVRLFWPSLAAWPLIAASALAGAWRQGEDLTLWAGSLAVSVACSIGAALLYRGSLLQREGPAR